MNLSPLEQRLYSEIEQIEVIDGHEHLAPESERTGRTVDVCTLFSHYTRGDLRAAGMSQADYDATQKYDLPLDYRWKLLSPYWERIRFGSYGRAALLAAQRFCGVSDINDGTYLEISEKLSAGNTPGLYERVLAEACGLRTCLTQCGRTDLGSPRLTPVMPIFPSGGGPPTWRAIVESAAGRVLHSLDDVVSNLQEYVVRVKAEGAVGLKMASNPFGAPDRAAAVECFEDLRRGATTRLPARTPLADYLIDEAIYFAGKQDLTIAVHAGYWGDFRDLDPTHMIPLLQRHPEVRFDIYHLGYPWMRETLMLGKGFPNVWLNLCWTHIISQRFAMDGIDEAIDLLPANKVIGFGGDYGTPVEKVYGHLVMAREDLARVFARRIERGQMSEDQAVGLARQWLWDNPKELYRLAF